MRYTNEGAYSLSCGSANIQTAHDLGQQLLANSNKKLDDIKVNRADFSFTSKLRILDNP